MSNTCEIKTMLQQYPDGSSYSTDELIMMLIKLQLDNNEKVGNLIDVGKFGLVGNNIFGFEGITLDYGETNGDVRVAINGVVYDCIVKDNVGKHERVVIVGGSNDKPVVSPIKKNRAGEVCGVLTENCIVGVKGISLGRASNGEPVNVMLGSKTYSCFAKSNIAEYEEVVIVGGTISEPFVFATSTISDFATSPTIYNITMTTADYQYSQILPLGTKMVEFRCRGAYDVRFAYETGKVATPTAPYRTLSAGQTKTIERLNLNSTTLYFACSTAAQVIELECWS